MISLQNALGTFQAAGHQIEQLGCTISGCRYFLAYNHKNGWYVKSLGTVQLIFRKLFGCYADTHLSKVAGQLGQQVSTSDLQAQPALCCLHRTLKWHWHKASSFPWKIDLCINCFARERFRQPNGVLEPFCGRSCAREFQHQPRPLAPPGRQAAAQPPSPQPAGQIAQQYIIPGYSFDRLLHELTAYSQRGFVDFYEVQYKPLTSIFGNFHPCLVAMNIAGRPYTFRCSEAAFQAHKFAHQPHLVEQFTTLDGDGSFRRARDLDRQKRPDWMSVNEQTMRDVLRAKFMQNMQLQRLLLATGSSVLVEHTARDRFWGDGGDGHGRNKLGEMLMRLRTELGGAPIPHCNLPQLVAAIR